MKRLDAIAAAPHDIECIGGSPCDCGADEANYYIQWQNDLLREAIALLEDCYGSQAIRDNMGGALSRAVNDWLAKAEANE